MNRRVISLALAILPLAAAPAKAEDARQIVEESQRRGLSDSQRYEGSLEVIGANNKVSKKHWQSDRLGSYGNSKAIIRFTEPAEVKGVVLLVINHTDLSPARLQGSVDVGSGYGARPPHRATGSLHAVLRHGFQLRRSGGARRQPVRFQPDRKSTRLNSSHL